MEDKNYKVILLSDFNSSNFSSYLNNNSASPSLKAIAAPYGQVMPLLVDGQADCWKDEFDVVVVWTQPENIIESFNKILNYQDTSVEAVLHEVDVFSKLLIGLQERVKFVFVPTWVASHQNRLFGMLDMGVENGITNILMRMNLRLAENVGGCSSIHLLNAQRWLSLVGEGAFNPKLWYMAKVPFGNDVFKEATGEIKSAIRGIIGKSKKIIILDLDNTLWGGTVGEEGWENIVLGGHSSVGEAYVDFQKALKSLARRGVLLGIVSKNRESVALEAIKNHSEMVLRLEDFAGWKINWNDKAQNTLDLMTDLNLGLESAVFIDDSPAERARVREAMPEVLVPEWPENPMFFKTSLLSFQCFNPPSLSREDLERKKMYTAEKQRIDVKKGFSSYEDWLKTLEMKVKVEELTKYNLVRAAQLLNKTNQMNLSTRRLSEDELFAWVKEGERRLWAIRVSDRFGDVGLVGLVSLDAGHRRGQIVDFVLSCRVMGRMVEEAMLHAAIKYAQSLGLESLWAEYIPTPKNIPCLEFWQNKSGFEYDESKKAFNLQIKKSYPIPDCIKIEGVFA